MIIKALTTENFKGIREPVRVEFKPITLLFGPNSAGKSTIVQALHYACELLERQNADVDITKFGGEFIDLGGFKNFVYGHDPKRSVKFTFELDLSNWDLPEYIDPQLYEINLHPKFNPVWDLSGKIRSATVSISVAFSEYYERPYIAAYETGINSEPFARISIESEGKSVLISYINFYHPLFEQEEKEFGDDLPASMILGLYDQIATSRITEPINAVNLEIGSQKTPIPSWGRSFEYSTGIISSDPQDISEPDHPGYTLGEFNAYMSQLLIGPGEVLLEALRSFRYLGPIRETPPRNYESLRFHEDIKWSNGMAAWDILHKADDPFIDKINHWLASETKLASGYRIRLKKYKEIDNYILAALREGHYLDKEEELREELEKLPLKSRVILTEETTQIEVLPQDIGVGISQVIPVIVMALHSNSGIVAIEQPELHIHPAFQIALGDLFISQINEQDVCFLLETHSEHLLLRLLRRIRETQENELPVDAPSLSPDKLSIHYIEQTEKGMSITPLQVDETGEFVNKWPRGFFEERDEELF